MATSPVLEIAKHRSTRPSTFTLIDLPVTASTMPVAVDVISPVLHVFVSVASQISPASMVERGANREKQIAVILEKSKHLFSPKELRLLRKSEHRVLVVQQLLPSTRLRDIAKHPVKVFTTTRRYYNRVEQYYLEAERVSATAQRRYALESATSDVDDDHGDHGGINQQQIQVQGSGGPAGRPPGVLRLKFENVEIEAGVGASLDLRYGADRSLTLSLNMRPSGEGENQNQCKHPRTYSVSGIAELVPDAAGDSDADEGVSNLGTRMPRYCVRSVTDLAITRVQDALDAESGSDDLGDDAASFVTACDGDGTSVLLGADGETFSISVDDVYDDNGDQLSIASLSLE
ncbi:hypothetical protein C8Q80DRAFT_1184530 [Daedaleopsis nitida]|nr:hypothetical protein C8Q80DRAFT_1184530 [Daedaleopsis nitida]